MGARPKCKLVGRGCVLSVAVFSVASREGSSNDTSVCARAPSCACGGAHFPLPSRMGLVNLQPTRRGHPLLPAARTGPHVCAPVSSRAVAFELKTPASSCFMMLRCAGAHMCMCCARHILRVCRPDTRTDVRPFMRLPSACLSGCCDRSSESRKC